MLQLTSNESKEGPKKKEDPSKLIVKKAKQTIAEMEAEEKKQAEELESTLQDVKQIILNILIRASKARALKVRMLESKELPPLNIEKVEIAPNCGYIITFKDELQAKIAKILLAELLAIYKKIDRDNAKITVDLRVSTVHSGFIWLSVAGFKILKESLDPIFEFRKEIIEKLKKRSHELQLSIINLEAEIKSEKIAEKLKKLQSLKEIENSKKESLDTLIKEVGEVTGGTAKRELECIKDAILRAFKNKNIKLHTADGLQLFFNNLLDIPSATHKILIEISEETELKIAEQRDGICDSPSFQFC